MVTLKGISDTINMLDKYNFDYKYDTKANTYSISDEDFEYMLETSKNKEYIENLQVGKGTTWRSSTHRDSLHVLSAIDVNTDEIVFTPAGILEILSGVEEFKDYDLSLTESLDGTLQLQVGDSFYSLENKESNDNVVLVDEEVIDTVDSIDKEAYQDLLDEGTLNELEPIDSGIVKEALKTLLIGGVVRMAKSYLKD